MKRKPGRPPKNGDEILNDRLEIRLTATEKTAYEKAAQVAGEERSDWIRAVLNKAAKKALSKSI